jgi:hypothetical protein
MQDSQAQAEQRAQAAQHEVDEREQEPGGWAQEDEELPRRPRLRLLAPLPVALFVGLALAGGFIAGVLVEKGQGEATSAGAGALTSRLAGLRTGGTRGLAGFASGSGSGSGSGGPSSLRSAGAGATVGQVAFIRAGTLYVTTGEGNTVKVTTAPGASVTKTVQASVGKIHPGETVIVTGSAHANGSIAASSIRVGGAGAAFGGGLFGGSSTASGAGSSGSSGSSGAGSGAAGAGGGPALFGNGG